jgi:hypothetical protein
MNEFKELDSATSDSRRPINDEGPMTNEARMPNDECVLRRKHRLRALLPFRHFGFVFRHSFVIGRSSCVIDRSVLSTKWRRPRSCLLRIAVIALSVAIQAASGTFGAEDVPYGVVVYGGTSGGVVAAVQAARMGARVVLIEPSAHLGGMTSGGLGTTDFGHPDSIGGLSREFYRRVKRHYSDPANWKYGTRDEYRSHRHDPQSDVMFHFEPHVAERMVLGQSAATAAVLSLDANISVQDVPREALRARLIADQQILSLANPQKKSAR